MNSERPLLSVVVPMYNEAEVIAPLFDRVLPVLESITDDFEIVCVDDGSTDNTLDLLRAWNRRDKRVKTISLTRNFGKEAALTAGLRISSGQAVVPLDADLQDPPEVIPQLVEKWREGFDMVLAVRSDRAGDSWLKRKSAALFYSVINRMSTTPVPDNTGDFRLMSRKVIDALLKLGERNRFMKGIFGWVGFSQTSIHYSRPSRVAGTSKWHYWKLWNFALDGMLSFSTAPLRIWTYLGVIVALFALSYMTYVIAKTLIFGADVPGYASIIVLLLFTSGLNMIGLGIIGEYLGRVFMEVKKRPLYLVDEEIGIGDGESNDMEQVS
jgi:glycosyltransferase involved in cell wall biosynthesis